MSANAIAADDKRRATGLVFLDKSLVDQPACHVLAIGVAAHQSKAFKNRLDTATISARAFVDWFADPQKKRFDNPKCSLGSAAIVLSETAGEAQSEYAGGPIPRATFGYTQAAVEAWVGRINSHKDNLAILYFAGHGESLLTRTGILLEDYGTKATDATFGMSEIEQFVGALEHAIPVTQLLLFDCCRNRTALDIPWTEQFGTKLISLTRNPDDHGEPRKQWTILGTSLGEYGAGLKNGPTLFNMALLEALNGVASDHATDDWPVRPGLLVDRIDKLLAMHRLPDEKAQTPAGRLAGSFDITFCGEPTDIPVYVTLKDPADWPDSTIDVEVDGVKQASILGKQAGSPFEIIRTKEGSMIEFSARRHQDHLGKARTKVRSPVTFVEIARQTIRSQVSLSKIRPGRDVTGAPRIAIDISSPIQVTRGGLVTIALKDKGNKHVWEQLSDLGKTTDIELPVGQSFEPGEYEITLLSPDGGKQTVNTRLKMGEEQTIGFVIPSSPHQWMQSSVLTGAIPPTPLRSDYQEGTDDSDGVMARPLGGLTVGLDVVDDFPLGISVSDGAIDSHFSEILIADETWGRFSKGELARPVFCEVIRKDPPRIEFVVAPAAGLVDPNSAGRWIPSFVVDRAAVTSRRMVTVAVTAPRWLALLGFLEARDATNGAKVLDERLSHLAINAIHDKVQNPLAAIAGALIAVGAAEPDLDKIWDRWLFNIAEWFPGLPDGPIVLARRLLTKARSEAELNEAKTWFVEGFRRGVPVFSLSVEWLARGLESFSDDDNSLAPLRKAARGLANRVDSAHAFTVIRIK